MSKRTAIMIDAGFFLRRFRYLMGSLGPDEVARELHKGCLKHLNDKDVPGGRRDLFRIFVYDCPPLDKRITHPLTEEEIDLGASAVAEFRRRFHNELKRMRKVVLRLGYLDEENARWQVKPNALKGLLAGELTVDDLEDDDLRYVVHPRGMEMMMGLDVATMAYKGQVDQIVLIAGSPDFVPAARLARLEGIDFVLDPMWQPIRDNLYEEVDGLKSVWPRPGSQDGEGYRSRSGYGPGRGQVEIPPPPPTELGERPLGD